MIISHSRKYVFVQLQRTGCTAVARELLEHYEGEPFLSKHSPFHEAREALGALDDYFIFSTVRHPLDDLVSNYEKLRTNHENYLEPARHHSQPGGYLTDEAIERFGFVQGGASFEDYFRRYRAKPYDNWSSLEHHSFDEVMRFETLADDFSAVVQRLGFDEVRPLPSFNKTDRSNDHLVQYFPTASFQRFISPFVSPFMRRWDYQFPEPWDQGSAWKHRVGEVAFRVLQPRRKRIWRRPAPSFDDGKQ